MNQHWDKVGSNRQLSQHNHNIHRRKPTKTRVFYFTTENTFAHAPTAQLKLLGPGVMPSSFIVCKISSVFSVRLPSPVALSRAM